LNVSLPITHIRFFSVVDPELICANIPQPDIHEICSSYSIEQNPISVQHFT